MQCPLNGGASAGHLETRPFHPLNEYRRHSKRVGKLSHIFQQTVNFGQVHLPSS
jgi:hypothetical protein